MSSEFNNLILTPNDIDNINPYIPSETNIYRYNYYIPKATYTQSVINSPIIPKIDTNYNKKSSFDIIDCDISMEDSTGINSLNYQNYNSRSRSPLIRMNYNNPINAINNKTNRARSPNIAMKSNLKLDSYINSYENNELSGNNSSLLKSNSISNYSIKSYSPPKENISNINYDINSSIPIQYQYNYNIGQNSYDTFQQQQMCVSPVKNINYNYQNNLEYSPIISRNDNFSSTRYIPRNITLMNSPQHLYNLIPEQNYQYLMPNSPFNTLNNNNISNLNNNGLNNNYTYGRTFKNISLKKPKQYKPKYKNRINAMKGYPNILTAHSNNASPIKTISQIKDINSISPPKISSRQGYNMNSDSKSSLSIINPYESIYNSNTSSSSLTKSNNNFNRTSSPNNINISCFNNQRMTGGKSSTISFNETNSKNINSRNSITSINSINNMKNISLKEGLNSTKSSIYKFNPTNNINTIRNSGIQSSNMNNNNNNNKFSLKDSNAKPTDKYSRCMLELINEIRKNPQNYAQKLKKAKDNIKYDKKGNLYYSGKIKVALYKGQEAFDEAIISLEKTKPMQPLLFKKELSIEISKDKKDFKNGEYLRKKINELVKSGTSVRAFWRDIINDVDINVLLMIVDDNPIKRGAKRKDILNPEMKYIGLNSGNIGSHFVCFTVLSDE